MALCHAYTLQYVIVKITPRIPKTIIFEPYYYSRWQYLISLQAIILIKIQQNILCIEMNTPAYLAILTSKRPIQYKNLIGRPFTIKHLPKQNVYNRKRPKASFLKNRMTTKRANLSTYSYQLASILCQLTRNGLMVSRTRTFSQY